VLGESNTLIETERIVLVVPPAECKVLPPKVTLVLLPLASPIANSVESRINLYNIFVVMLADAEPFVFTITKILLEVDRGVIVAVRPVRVVNVVDDIVKVSVLVVDTTCKIPPDRDTAPIQDELPPPGSV